MRCPRFLMPIIHPCMMWPLSGAMGVHLRYLRSLQGGKIGGLLQVRDVDVVGFQDRVDRLAAVLVNEFNQQHQAGFALDDTTNNLFFSALTPPAPVASDTNSGTSRGNLCCDYRPHAADVSEL